MQKVVDAVAKATYDYVQAIKRDDARAGVGDEIGRAVRGGIRLDASRREHTKRTNAHYKHTQIPQTHT